MNTFCAAIPEDPDTLVFIFSFIAVAGVIYFHWRLAFWKTNPVNPYDNRSNKAWEFVREVIADNRKKETPLGKSIYWAMALGLYGVLALAWATLPGMFVISIIDLTRNYIC